LKGRDQLVDLVIDVRIILKWIFERQDATMLTGFMGITYNIPLSTDHELIPAGCKRPYCSAGEYRAFRWTEDFLMVSDKEP
jgi:hypothetical protein